MKYYMYNDYFLENSKNIKNILIERYKVLLIFVEQKTNLPSKLLTDQWLICFRYKKYKNTFKDFLQH